MLVVAILIERAVEVIFGIWREPDDRRLEGLASDARHVTRSLLTPARDDEAFRTLAAARVGTLASAARDAPEVLLSKLSINAETIAGANLAAIADTANRIETGARAAIRERAAARTGLSRRLAERLFACRRCRRLSSHHEHHPRFSRGIESESRRRKPEDDLTRGNCGRCRS
jgi:hypothetical protein